MTHNNNSIYNYNVSLIEVKINDSLDPVGVWALICRWNTDSRLFMRRSVTFLNELQECDEFCFLWNVYFGGNVLHDSQHEDSRDNLPQRNAAAWGGSAGRAATEIFIFTSLSPAGGRYGNPDGTEERHSETVPGSHFGTNWTIWTKLSLNEDVLVPACLFNESFISFCVQDLTGWLESWRRSLQKPPRWRMNPRCLRWSSSLAQKSWRC